MGHKADLAPAHAQHCPTIQCSQLLTHHHREASATVPSDGGQTWGNRQISPHLTYSTPPQSNAASSSRITTERLVPVYRLVAADMGHTADLVTAHAKKSCAIHCSQQLLTHHHQEASATVRSGGGQTWGTRQIWPQLTHSTPPQSNAASSSRITTGRLVPLYGLVAGRHGAQGRSGPTSRTALPHNPMQPVPHASPPRG